MRTFFSPLCFTKAPFLLFVILLSGFLSTACSEQNQKNKSNNSTYSGRSIEAERWLSFKSATGDSLARVHVQIADDDLERATGLMDVRHIPDSLGMIFIFPEAHPLSFWMANTPSSLDIMFVDADSTILTIHSETTPFSEQQYTSGEKDALFAVETRAGFSLDHNIKVGDKISFEKP